MLPCSVLLPGGMRGGSPKAGSAANRASVGVQSSPLPASLAGRFIGIQGLLSVASR
jgi:hypothetical protein